jgi:3-oxoacyl-[acyl-carrier-protein] synthase-3
MLKGNGLKILSSGSFLPKNIVKNNDLDSSIGTSDEWIKQRTGICQRQIASSDEDSASMGFEASKNAIENFKKINPDFSIDEIDLIIVATTTPNKIFPSVAAQIGGFLGLKKNLIVFDLNAVCSGFLYAFIVANNMISSSSGEIKKALIVGSEKMSSILDWNDRSTCVLFGDGAGAVLLGHDGEDNHDIGLIDYIFRSDTSLNHILYANNKDEFLKMNGKEVFMTASKELEKSIRDICEKNSISIDQIDLFLIHQSNERILKFLAESLGVPGEKFLVSISVHANTSAASIPLLIDYKKDLIKSNSLILIGAVGGGMVWGCCLFKT